MIWPLNMIDAILKLLLHTNSCKHITLKYAPGPKKGNETWATCHWDLDSSHTLKYIRNTYPDRYNA